ncbi:hypothetical protein ACFWNE_07530 [Streptomyces goshikiensis]|uniref:hypothetical protein n=1 Tax=Streptomyces goshikiensis TaxID=1942 RepID=UPI0036638913
MTGDWMTVDEFVKRLDRDPVYLGFMQVVTNHGTRRMVTVATRKYKARRRRKG